MDSSWTVELLTLDELLKIAELMRVFGEDTSVLRRCGSYIINGQIFFNKKHVLIKTLVDEYIIKDVEDCFTEEEFIKILGEEFFNTFTSNYFANFRHNGVRLWKKEVIMRCMYNIHSGWPKTKVDEYVDAKLKEKDRDD